MGVMKDGKRAAALVGDVPSVVALVGLAGDDLPSSEIRRRLEATGEGMILPSPGQKMMSYGNERERGKVQR